MEDKICKIEFFMLREIMCAMHRMHTNGFVYIIGDLFVLLCLSINLSIDNQLYKSQCDK